MSEKKRVRVYAPQVNMDHFANYMFQVGGPVGQGPMPAMQQSQDISNDIIDLLQMYAQAKGIDEQQLQQIYASIMEMEPDQQQQVISQMQQELGSQMAGNPMVAKKGGYIKETKKLLAKKIGGVSTNATSKDLVGQRLQNIMDNIGIKVVNNINNEVAEDQLKKADNQLARASENFAMASMPTMDYGGYVNDMYNMGMGYSSGEDNPFIQDVIDTKMDFRTSLGELGNEFLNIDLVPGRTIIKKKGPMFGENPAVASTEPPSASSYTGPTSNQYAEQMFGLKNGGKIPTYQTAGTIDIGTGKYDPVTKTITGTDGTTRVVDEDEANWIMSQMSFGKSSGNSDQTTTTSNNQASTNTETGSGVSGWHGGFYWQNGVPVASWDDMEKQAAQNQQGSDWASIFKSPDRKIRIQNNILDMARNPAMIKQFGKALTEFQPDNVYLSKAKGRVNPFGAKVVLKWDYDENGRPVQKEVVEGEEESRRGFLSGDKDNLMGQVFRGSDMYQNMVQKRAERNARRLGYNVDEEQSNQGTGTGYKSPVMGRTSGSGMESIYEPEVTSPNPVYTPVTPSPRQTIEDLDTEEFAYGGMPKARAGKMVIKQQFMPATSDAFQMYTPLANAAKSALNMRGLNEQEEMAHLADFYTPSIPMGYGSMGTKFVGPGMGSESRFNPMFGATGNYADSLYQNEPTFGIAPSIGYQRYNRRDGGMYQEGGAYEEVSEDDLLNLFAKGGKVQYF